MDLVRHATLNCLTRSESGSEDWHLPGTSTVVSVFAQQQRNELHSFLGNPPLVLAVIAIDGLPHSFLRLFRVTSHVTPSSPVVSKAGVSPACLVACRYQAGQLLSRYICYEPALPRRTLPVSMLERAGKRLRNY
jgi:hypothetical protein